jgi:cystathionine beta-lyase
MQYDFDQIITRDGTASVKYEARGNIFGKQDIIPLWVADMDFAVPEAVQRALIQRAEHPVYGYTVYPDALYTSLLQWLEHRHHWQVERESIVPCPGVVPSLHAAIMACSTADDGIIVQPPVYAPFMAAPAATGRKLLLNPLKLQDGRSEFDLEDLARCAKAGGKILILCSPHNPVGRVWQEQELTALLAVCEKYSITVISDEIHHDLVYPGTLHMPKLARGRVNVITAVAPSKTFNIAGLGLSALIVPQQKDREAIATAFGTLHVSAANPFSITAFAAAYSEGAAWLDALLNYLAGNRDFVRNFISRQLPQIRLIEAEGTYLLWLDCRAMSMDDKQLKHFFVHEAGVGLSPGILFGEQGSGFMRMNIGAPLSLIKQALQQISNAIEKK